MQAPGFRMNEREANPNPYVGFIRALRQKGNHDDAEHILKAVAAQMKKIMEQRFMFVQTLEEAAYNRVFAGRNWNYGQSIELVLRGPSGNFLPLPYIISVMCHEMAHIQQMNHGPKFQKLMAEIKADVRSMQAKGHYGDGFWSDGHRLRDSARMGRSDLPEYVCGVTTGDATRATRPRRKPPSSQMPGLVKGKASHRSGRQTEYRRKAGRRNNAEMGASSGRLDGRREISKEDREERQHEIDERVEELVKRGMPLKTAKTKAAKEWNEDNPWIVEGSTRGKVAKSKTAAELRAEAAEKRLAALSGVSQDTPQSDIKYEDEDVYDSESEDVEVQDPHFEPERRRADIENDTSETERRTLRDEWEEFFEAMKSQELGKRSSNPDSDNPIPHTNAKIRRRVEGAQGGFGTELVKEERKRGLGLASTSTRGKGQVVGSAHVEEEVGVGKVREDDGRGEDSGSGEWACKQCTYVNIPERGRCEMCNARPDGSMPQDVQ